MAWHKSLRFVGVGLLLTTGICWLLAWKLDDWLHSAAINYIAKKTHYGVSIQTLHTDLKHGIVEIHGLDLTNPSEFPEPRFLRFNEIKIHVNLLSLLSNKIVFDEIVLDIDELAGVRNQQGKTNIQLFAEAIKKTSKPASASDKPLNTKAASSKEFLVYRLFFRLGEVTLADFKEGKEDITSHHVGLARVFNNVSSYSQVLMPLVSDLSSFASTFILESILKSTLDTKSYVEVMPKVLNPLKETLQKAKTDTEKFFEKVFGEKKSTKPNA